MFVSDGATILHADLDSFYASVEQRDDPRLRGQPVIVGGGVVLAASYEAKAFGVRSAMNGREARRRCPHAIVVAPRIDAYTEASRAVFAVFDDTTPLVEGLSIDEAFLDVGGLARVSGTPTEIAVRLRREVLERVGLPITVGVARTKFLAKVASGVAKPDGLLVVPPERELDFLHPLPIERLWGVGPITASKMRDRGINTVGEVAPARRRVARRACSARRRAGTSTRSRTTATRARSRSAGGAGRWARSTRSAAGPARARELDAIAAELVDRVTRRMRAADRAGRTVVLRLRFGDFSRITRSHTLPRATAQTEPILATVLALLHTARPMIEQHGITLLGIAVANLDDGITQLVLPFDRRAGGALDAALDDVRDRFGSAAVTRAARLGSDPGISVPMLPD